ncbi:hypothetical protein BDF14DRAFT_1778819 [Spinellus fusiger]|nr:hypothetical protein BDF14DRAFT_1778819 [Spinellus fusiger]
MQPMPYYQQGYQQPPYATTAPPASSVMSAGPSLVNHTHGLPPLQHPIDANASSAAALAATAAQGAKRKQVKNACTNCQKACKKCDDSRPCPRCVKYGVAETCVNSVRKERKKGIKRGPYKRRLKGDSENNRQMNGTDAIAQVQPQTTPVMRYMPFGYPTNLNQYGQPPYDPYSQYAAAYHKDQMMPSYVNPYPMYPVMVPQAEGAPHGYQPSPMSQHYNGMMQSPQPSRPLAEQTLQQQQSGPPPVYYHPSSSGAPPTSQRASPNDIKEEVFVKPQPMTPVPSTSTSSNTASSADSAEEDDSSKFARLSQLCSAALNQTDATHH